MGALKQKEGVLPFWLPVQVWSSDGCDLAYWNRCPISNTGILWL